ncbi:repressor LexA [Desulfallas thermosapovorans DSM 6562]|uniref:Repressor LexA n=2 Tax=Desulfallas thermosapovorans TaxID=58137 RepID=A0A5S4ZQS6_9FIRM|nr:repressor LexA [Desulfallas thermosapovorans DSM 6562]
MDNNFGETLRELRESKGFTVNQLAIKSGVSAAHISRLENERRSVPKPKTIKKLAKALGNLDKLMEAAGHLINKKQVDIIDALANEDTEVLAGGQLLTPDQRLAIARALDNPSMFKKNTIPILGKVPAGIPIMAIDEWDGELEIPSDIEADFALQVRGDSMIGAGIHDGDYAICREAYGANSGDIVVALEDVGPEYSRGTLKYYIQENGRDVLRAANPSYEDIPLGGNHRITGIMIGLIRMGSTPLSYYREYIAIRDYHLKKWNDVIEELAKYGMEPSAVKQILVPQLEYLNRIAKGEK